MEIKLMSLGLEVTPEIVEAQGKIESLVETLFGEQKKFESFNSEKIFITELSNAVKQDDIIVLSAEPELFVPFKNFIAKAFNIKKKINKQLAKHIRLFHPEIRPDSEEFEGQATIPNGAFPLLSEDGMYSGFAIKSNQRIVLVIPLDVGRLEFLLQNSTVGYLAQAMPETVKIEEEEQESDQTPFNESLISDTVEKLIKSNKAVAFADTKTVDFLGAVSASVHDLLKVVLISEFSIEKGKMPPREYAIKLARGARESLGTPLGASLTNVFTVTKEDGTKDMFIYSCIADDSRANAIKIYAKKDESLPQLVFHAINELFKMISLWAETGKVIPPLPEKPKDEKHLKKEKQDKKHKTQIKIMVGVMLILSIAASFIVTAYFDDIYNLRGTLSQKEQSQVSVDEGNATPAAQEVNASADATNDDELNNEHGGLELDSVFIDYINNQSSQSPQETTKPTTESTTSKTTSKETTTAKSPQTTTRATTTLPASTNYPATLLLDGKEVATAEAIARIVEAEMGSGFNTDALKAQTVAVFSYIKYNNWSTSGLSKKATYSDKVMQAVKAVLGKTVTYNGKTALTPFFAMSAGKTVNSTTVWNINKPIPYLSGGIISEEKNSGLSGYQTTKTYSSSELKSMIESKLQIALSSNPSGWIKILAHDSSVSSSVGYVSSMTVGEKTISGHVFRTSVMGYSIRSHCFDVSYSADGDVFTFTVYGYGHGVGMSQQGANYYANQGFGYEKIIKHYFPGTQVE